MSAIALPKRLKLVRGGGFPLLTHCDGAEVTDGFKRVE